MDKIPRLNKEIVEVTSLDDSGEEKKYWLSKSPCDYYNRWNSDKFYFITGPQEE